MPNPKPSQFFFSSEESFAWRWRPKDSTCSSRRACVSAEACLWCKTAPKKKSVMWKKLERILFWSSNFFGGEVPGSSLSGLLIERRRWVVLCCSRVPKSLRHSDSWHRWCVCFSPSSLFSLLPLLFFLYSFSFFQCRIFVGTCGFCDAEFELLNSWKERNKQMFLSIMLLLLRFFFFIASVEFFRAFSERTNTRPNNKQVSLVENLGIFFFPQTCC